MEMALLKCFSWYIGGVCYVSKERVICKMSNIIGEAVSMLMCFPRLKCFIWVRYYIQFPMCRKHLLMKRPSSLFQ